MKLPNCDDVLVSKEKLANYILSETHSLGKFKAKFFYSLGFDQNNSHLLEKSLRNLAKSEAVKETVISL